MNKENVNMNKKLIAVIAVALIIAGGVWIIQAKRSKTSTQTPVALVAEGDAKKFATLQDAYKSGESLKCSVTMPSQKFVAYFKDRNIRYESSITSGTTTVEAGQIVKKNVAYGWTNTSSTIVTTTDLKTIEFYRNLTFGLDALISNPVSNVKLTCTPTTLSESLFDKPKN